MGIVRAVQCRRGASSLVGECETKGRGAGLAIAWSRSGVSVLSCVEEVVDRPRTPTSKGKRQGKKLSEEEERDQEQGARQ